MTPRASTESLRVVQWATGGIGTRALRGIIEHPRLTLAGLYVHSPDKAGMDAGELCGLPATGVTATSNIDEILALDADCVLYAPRHPDPDELSRILASGANVVSTCGQFHHPPSMDPALRTAIDTACRTGQTSVHSTGSSPGFITEALPLVLTSIQRRLTHLAIHEYADLSARATPGIVFDVMGFGAAPEQFATHRAEHLRAAFGPSLRLVADALGTPLDEVSVGTEIAVTTRDVPIAAGVVPAGTVGAQRITISGKRAGETLIEFRAIWYCTDDLDPAWETRATGWHMIIDGDAPLDIDIKFPITLEQLGRNSGAYTANRAVNAIAPVCAAQPGIRTTLDLPMFGAVLG
ncbi:MAG: dihydrodipicolinate reductase [Nocardia sp.]|nr:dihydrodipicolinate reductase [Nocardia sp.]